ncbi:MAG: hypothetical protein ACK5XG_09425 [Burkholderiales bacterium]
MADDAQRPHAGIRCVESVVARLGEARTDTVLCLHTAPRVDHVGTGDPASAPSFTCGR